jgi:hypothetical protein
MRSNQDPYLASLGRAKRAARGLLCSVRKGGPACFGLRLYGETAAALKVFTSLIFLHSPSYGSELVRSPSCGFAFFILGELHSISEPSKEKEGTLWTLLWWEIEKHAWT